MHVVRDAGVLMWDRYLPHFLLGIPGELLLGLAEAVAHQHPLVEVVEGSVLLADCP